MAIDAPPLEEIADPDIRAAIEQDASDGLGDTLWLRVLARSPGDGGAFYRFFRQAGWEGGVDHPLKEIIRIRLAQLAGDAYFSNLRSQAARAAGLSEERIDAGCGDLGDDAPFDAAERIAIRYADLMFRDKAQLDADFYGALKQHYSEPQIMEMGSWAALSWGLAGWFCTMGLYPEHDREGNAIGQTESAELYGAVASVEPPA